MSDQTLNPDGTPVNPADFNPDGTLTNTPDGQIVSNRGRKSAPVVPAKQYRILHDAVGTHYKGEVVSFEDGIDTDRLLRLGAVEAV